MAKEKLKKAFRDDKGRHVIVEHNGVRFEVREPTVGEKARSVDAYQLMDGKPAIEKQRVLAQVLVRCVYDPDDGTRVWEDNEAEEILEGRTIANLLGNALVGLMKDAAGEAGKGSEETAISANGSSSASSSAAH